MKSFLFSFSGRIGRKQFWLTSLFMLVINIVAFIPVVATFDEVTQTPGIIGLIILLAVLVFNTWVSLALYVKRFHDRDKSGWWVLISIVPIIGPIWLLVECGFLRGSIGVNQFGSDPVLNK